MPINIPTYKEITDRIIADIASSLPDIDPTISGSFINALAISNAGRHYDFALLLQQILKELFPQTASGEFLERWAQYEGLSRLPATASSGLITVTGVLSTVIPALTEWRTANNTLVSSISAGSISAKSFSISSLTRSGSTVTGVTVSAHEIATGTKVTVSGAVESDYNGEYKVTVLNDTTFQYEITGTPSTPATGTIFVDFNGASIEVEANDPGKAGNLGTGAELQITSPISGVDDTAYVQCLGLTGGGDDESDDSLRERVMYSRSNPVANFNESNIIRRAMSVPGVTRVWVNRITPYVGAVTVAFMRDNDPDPIPDPGEVADVLAVLMEILPAQTHPNDLIVTAPSKVTVDFIFSNLSPDTGTMRAAVVNSLAAFFIDAVGYGTDIDEDQYRSAIINTYDTDTGSRLQSFSLVTPVGDVSIDENGIGVLGDINFP